MSIVFDAYRKCWDRYTLPRFRKNPEWLQIESEKITTDGGTVTYDHENSGLRLFDQLDVQERVCPRRWSNPASWGWMIHWWMKEHGLRATRHNVKSFIQRGRRGYSDRNLWSLDGYLAHIIASSVRELADKAHGVPVGLELEEWQEILRSIADGFDAGERLKWDNDLADYDRPALEIANNTGWSYFREYFSHLWD